MIPWPFAAVLALGWAVTLFVAVVQTRRLRDRPTRWERDHFRDATEKVGNVPQHPEGGYQPKPSGRTPQPPTGGSVVSRPWVKLPPTNYQPRGEP